jgi:hypothetical protein
VKLTELFIDVVRNSSELPLQVRSNADQATGIQESCFDESYIQFLDEQIRLNPRGQEWTEILRHRRNGLLSFCNVPLISGRIRTDTLNTWIKIDPKKKTVVFWEQLEHDITN